MHNNLTLKGMPLILMKEDDERDDEEDKDCNETLNRNFLPSSSSPPPTLLHGDDVNSWCIQVSSRNLFLH